MAMSGMGSDSDSGSPAVVRHRPYLNKRAREILNKESRRIWRDQPDWVDDPSDPDADELLESLQRERDDYTDTELLIDLLASGLTPAEAVAWVLFRHGGLDPREIFYAEEGKQSAGRSGIDDAAVRHVHSRLDSAAMKLGVEFDTDRSRYMTE